ncbi:type II toxin-antitoxin system RelE/ParE family toxin [candidate division KSB1 bacterium]|nr:type II toxin-antitoxin system RelE/ParE family toxin [candidate division KSB1 bacterium]RQW02648.1 MAG: type II toxin-antitoxin system RelE/ParE family toxin [candidate division KSB1 bacterium]
MQIIWTHEALNRLADIEEYISKDSSERAANFVNYLIDRAETLKDHPKIGRVVPEMANKNIRELIFRKYRIIYQVFEKRIEIITVFEGHRLLRLEELDIN